MSVLVISVFFFSYFTNNGYSYRRLYKKKSWKVLRGFWGATHTKNNVKLANRAMNKIEKSFVMQI